MVIETKYEIGQVVYVIERDCEVVPCPECKSLYGRFIGWQVDMVEVVSWGKELGACEYIYRLRHSSDTTSIVREDHLYATRVEAQAEADRRNKILE